MEPSMFNVRVSLEDRGEVFLINTLTDAQLLVSDDVAELLDRVGRGTNEWTNEECEALTTLVENGFIVESAEADHRNLREFFDGIRESREQLRMTVLTTLQCNFACDYCIQGDHGDYNRHAARMSLETAEQIAGWTERRLDQLAPATYVLTFFGGEPLLNLPVVYYLSERLWNACQQRRIRMLINVITNGLLLTPEVVDRLAPFGLNGVKITLDGERDTHNRMRPLRGGQGTFDRIIANIRQVANRCHITIGGNFDATSVESYPALLDFLRDQEFADRLAKVAFKPIIRQAQGTAPSPAPRGSKFIPLTAVSADERPLNGACMTSTGTSTGACDSCHELDDQMAFLREETRKHGFPTVDGVHMGPCDIHKRHSYTIGIDGGLYACPGFAADAHQSTGHVDGRTDPLRARTAERFDALAAWKECGDCAFIPVCAGGCTVAAHNELGDMNRPACHKRALEAGVVALARDVVAQLPASIG